MTTGRDQELGNIEKCFAAGYSEVVLIGASERHAKTLSKFIEENLEEKDRGKVRYIHPDTVVDCLDAIAGPPRKEEQVVRGYKVRTVQQVVDPKEASERRQAIAEVIARSLRRSKDS